jgi:hypothetical protein
MWGKGLGKGNLLTDAAHPQSRLLLVRENWLPMFDVGGVAVSLHLL